MTRPDDIAGEVWETATAVYYAVLDAEPLTGHSIEIIARAILAERERCANVAYDAAVKAFDGPCLSEVAIMGAADIAAAIRSGKQ